MTGFKETNIPPSGFEGEEVIGRASLVLGSFGLSVGGREIPAAGNGPLLKTADNIYRKWMIRNKTNDATE